MKTILILAVCALAGCKHRPPAPAPHAPGEPALEHIPPQNLPVPQRMPSRRIEMSLDAPVQDPAKARLSAKVVSEF